MNDTDPAVLDAPRVPTRMGIEEWLAEGKLRFGEDPLQWRFQCPSCGYVQTPADFRAHQDKGATAESAMHVCLGTFWRRSNRRAYGHQGEGPCEYADGGLFNMNPAILTDAAGKEHRIFAFAG